MTGRGPSRSHSGPLDSDVSSGPTLQPPTPTLRVGTRLVDTLKPVYGGEKDRSKVVVISVLKLTWMSHIEFPSTFSFLHYLRFHETFDISRSVYLVEKWKTHRELR